MKKISKSPERHSFQKEGYAKRQIEKGEPINEDYLDLFEKMIEQDKHKFDDPARRENNLEYDLLTTDWILEKVRSNENYSQNLYSALCNNDFQKREMWPILKEQKWSCSWRYAGGIIADMREEGDYIDWYCSGIRGAVTYDDDIKDGYVPEGVVTDEIRDDLFKLGWLVINEEKDD